MIKKFKRMTALGSIYSLGGLLHRLTAFFLIPVYTYFLSTEDYGIIGLMTITVTLVSLITSGVVRGFPRHYYAPESSGKRKELVFSCLVLTLIPSAICAAIFYKMSLFWAGTILDNSAFSNIIKIYAFILIAEPVMELSLALLRLEERAKAHLAISFSHILSSALFTLYFLIIKKAGVLSLVYARLYSDCFVLLLLLPYMSKRIKVKFDFPLIKPSMSYGYASFLTGLSQFAIESSNRYILRIFGSLSSVGLFSFGYTFASILKTLIVAPLKGTFEPLAYKMEREPRELRRFTSKSCTYFYILALYICLALSMFSRDLLLIMARKKEFVDAWKVIPVIGFTFVNHGLGTFFNWGLVMRKKVLCASAIFITAAAISVGLSILLIPKYGIVGAATATMVSYLVWNALKIYFSAKFYDLHFELKRLLHITVVGVGLYGVSIFAANTGMVILNVFIKFTILFIYAAYFYWTKFFTLNEKMHVKKVIASVKEKGLRGIFAAISEV